MVTDNCFALTYRNKTKNLNKTNNWDGEDDNDNYGEDWLGDSVRGRSEFWCRLWACAPQATQTFTAREFGLWDWIVNPFGAHSTVCTLNRLAENGNNFFLVSTEYDQNQPVVRDYAGWT